MKKKMTPEKKIEAQRLKNVSLAITLNDHGDLRKAMAEKARKFHGERVEYRRKMNNYKD